LYDEAAKELTDLAVRTLSTLSDIAEKCEPMLTADVLNRYLVAYTALLFEIHLKAVVEASNVERNNTQRNRVEREGS